jgi:excinuclease ABC subunit A
MGPGGVPAATERTRSGALDKIIDSTSRRSAMRRGQSATHRPVRADPRLVRRAAGSRARGYKPGQFGFSVKGGVARRAGGARLKIEIRRLSHGFTCDVCRGGRAIVRRWRQSSATSRSPVLAMTVDGGAISRTAADHAALPPARVGLGYRAGQRATTLSGEAQRIKLSKELARRATGRTLCILDEPTTSLHFEDVRKLLECFTRWSIRATRLW